MQKKLESDVFDAVRDALIGIQSTQKAMNQAIQKLIQTLEENSYERESEL